MQFDRNNSILVVVCKRPAPGTGKQRIAAELGRDRAFELAQLLLAAALEDATAWQGDVVIAPATADDAEWAAGLLEGCRIVPQSGGNLGARINHVDNIIRAAGGRYIVYIGTDAPGLTDAGLADAAAALRNSDVVLQPASDGGVVLMAAAQPWPDLTTLPWETAALGAALQTCCVERGLVVRQLQPGEDLDRQADFPAILNQLQCDARPARRELADWLRRRQAISVIVPVYRDAEALQRLMRRLATQLRDGDELIVVAAGDDPAVDSVCAHFSARQLRAEPCRGAQLDAGAQAACNDTLWFLHADSEPDAGAADAVRHSTGGGSKGGYLRFRFQGRRGFGKRLLESLINLRARLGTPYGDQALFARRDAYAAAGGFAHEPLFEEVPLVRRLRRAGRFQSVPVAVGVSPRRWERDGWLRRTLHNRMLALGYMLGIAPQTLARRYR